MLLLNKEETSQVGKSNEIEMASHGIQRVALDLLTGKTNLEYFCSHGKCLMQALNISL